MKVIINGAGGRMGQALTKIISSAEDAKAVCLSSMEFQTDEKESKYKSISEYAGEADVIIDFSNHSATEELCLYAKERNLPIVFATTGQTPEELEMIKNLSQFVPVFYSQNMSLGVAVLSCLAKITSKAFPESDIEIVEKHHNQKLDSPSGTAILLADAIKSVRSDVTYKLGRSGFGKREKNEIGIHALRMGNEVGTHEIIFSVGSQTITLKHEAHDRSLFAEGALSAARFLVKQEKGFYNMDNILD